MIIVRVENKILGDSTFWEGPEENISEIRNLVAQELAKKVVQDGVTRREGMWVVEQKQNS